MPVIFPKGSHTSIQTVRTSAETFRFWSRKEKLQPTSVLSECLYGMLPVHLMSSDVRPHSYHSFCSVDVSLYGL